MQLLPIPTSAPIHLLYCPWYQFLLTPTLLTTSLNESLYNYDCWWAMTQMCTGCHYMNIKVIHRQAWLAGPSAADPSHSKHCWRLHLGRVPAFICGFNPLNRPINQVPNWITIRTSKSIFETLTTEDVTQITSFQRCGKSDRLRKISYHMEILVRMRLSWPDIEILLVKLRV